MKFYVLKYNNYINREIKKFNTLEAYRNANCIIDEATQYQCNFKEADGVDTTQVVNIQGTYDTLNRNYELKCNYAIVTTDSDIIISRWFVLEAVKTRDLQFTLTLHRDVIADNYDAVVNAPAYIERATIRDINSPLLFNNESDTYNQILKEGVELSDATGEAYYTIYMSPKLFTSVNETNYFVPGDIITTDAELIGSATNLFYYKITGDKSLSISKNGISYKFIGGTDGLEFWTNFELDIGLIRINTIPTNIGGSDDAIPGQIVIREPSDSITLSVTLGNINSNTGTIIYLNNNGNITIQITGKQLLDMNGRPYVILSYPKHSLNCTGNTATIDSDYTRQIAAKLTEFAGDYIYDIQILPFCPALTIWDNNNKRFNFNFTDHDYTRVDVFLRNKSGPLDIGCMILNILTTQMSDYFENPSSDPAYDAPTDIETLKMNNDTSVAMLCDPLAQQTYQFSPVKNGGVKRFLFRATMKPINPYIYVIPEVVTNQPHIYTDNMDTSYNRNGLYCTGDYSIERTTDQYMQYLLNNKNYMSQFNSNLDTIDARIEANSASGALGIASNAISFLTTLGMAGAGEGSVGGNAQGLLGLPSSIVNFVNDRKLMQLEKSNAINAVNYNLGNIKSRANTYSKVTGWNWDASGKCKLLLFDCTNTEKQALKNKLKYNGMRVGVIGKIADYTVRNELSFVQADLIKLSGFNEDAHMLSTIKNELQKGVFI